MKKKWFSLSVIGAFLVSVLLLVLVFYWLKPTTASETIPQEEIIKMMEELYSGQMVTMKSENGQYVLELKKESGNYEISVDSGNGKVLSVIPITTEPTTDDNTNNEKDNNTGSGHSNNDQRLTKEQIKDLITQESPGKIDYLELIEENQAFYYKAIVLNKNKKIILEMEPTTGEVISRTSEKIEQSNQFITTEQAISIAKDYLNGEVEDIAFRESDNLPYYLVEIEANDNEAIIQIHAVSGKILSVTWDYDDDDDDGEDDDDDE